MMNPTTKGTAVVVGATGIVGRAVAAKLAEHRSRTRGHSVRRGGPRYQSDDRGRSARPEGGARAVGASRQRDPPVLRGLPPSDKRGCGSRTKPGMLVNAVEGLEAVGAPLQHVTLITGTSITESMSVPLPPPPPESEPRHIGPNFYYAQEDYLRSRRDAAWRWTNLVPTHLTGFATGNPMNLASRSRSMRHLSARPDFALIFRVPRRPSPL